MKKFAFTAAFLFLFIWALPQGAHAARLLIPGGQVIGINLQDHSVTVAAFHEKLGAAAKEAGLKQGDRITKVDDQPVTSAGEIRELLAKTDGDVVLSVARGNSTKTLRFCPAPTPEGPKLGVYLKEGITGIGTVTWYDPQADTFGALGHGVNTPNGNLAEMESGTVYDASVMAIRKGQPGKPGQLMGAMTDTDPTGDLSKNTSRGVFGNMETQAKTEPLPTAESESIHTGAATIRSTIASGEPQDYSVEILKIYPNRTDSGRNLLLRVTDPELLAATGGIVQGMGVSYNRDNTGNPNSLRGFQVTDP